MNVKTRAVVLQAIKYGDSQLIVEVFSENMGRLSFIVRAPKSPKAKIKRQFFQPLMVLNIEFEYRAKAGLQKLKDVGISIPFIDISCSSYKLAISMFLSELLKYATKNEQQNEPLFRFLIESISWLDHATGNFANFHIVFLIRLTFFLGFSPNVESGTEGKYFDLEDGCFVPYVPAHRRYLSEGDSIKLLTLFRLSYKTMHLYTMSRIDRNRCVEVILEYYKIHVPGFPELKSFSVLQELFAS